MGDAAVATKLAEDNNKVVYQLTSTSDGTGESAVTKVDVSALSPPCTKVRIEKIIYSTYGMKVKLLWDATTDTIIITLPEDKADHLDFSEFGGLKNDAGAGVTGDIKLTTIGHTNLDSYTIVLVCRKSQ